MTKSWSNIPAEDVVVSEPQQGSGVAVLVSKIEDTFMGTDARGRPSRSFRMPTRKGHHGRARS
jgi:hypothetical protein